MKKWGLFFSITMVVSIICVSSALGEDSEVSRGTLAGLHSLGILIEPIQPNIQKYAEKYGLNAQQIQSDIEQRLKNNGLRIASGNEWLNVPGRPVLYININTHETEKYWYAYDIKLELRQLVYLEANPKIRTLADTWSINITGIANIGNLHVIKHDAMVLVDRFIKVYKLVNSKR